MGQSFAVLMRWNKLPSGISVATPPIRNVNIALKEGLRTRASQRGRSMEAEAPQILEPTLTESGGPLQPNLAEAIRRRFAPLGGIDVELAAEEFVEAPPSVDP